MKNIILTVALALISTLSCAQTARDTLMEVQSNINRTIAQAQLQPRLSPKVDEAIAQLKIVSGDIEQALAGKRSDTALAEAAIGVLPELKSIQRNLSSTVITPLLASPQARTFRSQNANLEATVNASVGEWISAIGELISTIGRIVG